MSPFVGPSNNRGYNVKGPFIAQLALAKWSKVLRPSSPEEGQKLNGLEISPGFDACVENSAGKHARAGKPCSLRSLRMFEHHPP